MQDKKCRYSVTEELRLKSFNSRAKAIQERASSQPLLVNPSAASGASSGGGGQKNNTINNYVVNDYVEDYFE